MYRGCTAFNPDLDQSIKHQTSSNCIESLYQHQSLSNSFPHIVNGKVHSEGTYFLFDLVMMKYKSKETVSTAVPVSAIFGVLMVMLAQTKT